MNLQDYRILRRISMPDAAKQIGVNISTFWRWENGDALPRMKWIMKIHDWSKGAVTANDLMEYRAHRMSQGGAK